MAAALPQFKAAEAYLRRQHHGRFGRRRSVAVWSVLTRLAVLCCSILARRNANPSPEDMQKIDAELTRHNKVHEFHTYPGAGHAFMDFYW